ncbi:MAG: HEPN domain-containing protein [Anaerolineales bacterium]|nr:HEPN domain-containing protein [Anaerolineales bacterium]
MNPLDPSDPMAWLQRASSNLHLAKKSRDENVMLEDLCFNAQQAAEKALKAVCLFRGLDFPKTHSLIRLMDIIEADGLAIPHKVKSADILTHYAVQTRYPSPFEEITRQEYREAVKVAVEVINWAEMVVGGEG